MEYTESLTLFRKATLDFLEAAHLPGDSTPTPVQASVYVAVACRTGEVGLQTLLGGFLRLRFHEEEKRTGTPHRLAVNRTFQGRGKGKQPDFQVLVGDATFPALVIECKLLDAEGWSNGHPNQVLGHFASDLKWLQGPDNGAIGFGCLFLVTSLGPKGAVFGESISTALRDLKAEWIGKPARLWKPDGVKDGPYSLEVVLIPAPPAADQFPTA